MGYIRVTTYKSAAYLIKKLWDAGTMHEMIEDGGDIILFRTPGGQTVSVHMIEGALPLYEIRQTLEYNAERGHFTMFMLWTRMMLPGHATTYAPDDWMEALFTLYGGCIYGYDVFEREVYMFPVYFQGDAGERLIHYGTTIHPARLTTRFVETDLPNFKGKWRVADMNGTAEEAYRAKMTPDQLSALDEAYILLEVTLDDDKETIKKAYRLLARRYHPDTNKSPEANDMMRKVNESYQQIIESLDD